MVLCVLKDSTNPSWFLSFDYPSVPVIGQEIVLYDEAVGDVILMADVETVRRTDTICPSGNIIYGSTIEIGLSVLQIDRFNVGALMAFQTGYTSEYRNDDWYDAHPGEWYKTLGREDAEHLSISQWRQMKDGSVDSTLRQWLIERHSHHVRDIDTEEFFQGWTEGVLNVWERLEVAIA